jgi:hypothetical protein
MCVSRCRISWFKSALPVVGAKRQAVLGWAECGLGSSCAPSVVCVFDNGAALVLILEGKRHCEALHAATPTAAIVLLSAVQHGSP